MDRLQTAKKFKRRLLSLLGDPVSPRLRNTRVGPQDPLHLKVAAKDLGIESLVVFLSRITEEDLNLHRRSVDGLEFEGYDAFMEISSEKELNAVVASNRVLKREKLLGAARGSMWDRFLPAVVFAVFGGLYVLGLSIGSSQDGHFQVTIGILTMVGILSTSMNRRINAVLDLIEHELSPGSSDIGP